MDIEEKNKFILNTKIFLVQTISQIIIDVIFISIICVGVNILYEKNLIPFFNWKEVTILYFVYGILVKVACDIIHRSK